MEKKNFMKICWAFSRNTENVSFPINLRGIDNNKKLQHSAFYAVNSALNWEKYYNRNYQEKFNYYESELNFPENIKSLDRFLHKHFPNIKKEFIYWSIMEIKKDINDYYSGHSYAIKIIPFEWVWEIIERNKT